MGDEWGLAWSLLTLGSESENNSEALFQEAILLFRRLNDLSGLTRALSSLGRFYLESKRDISDRARALLEESLKIAEAIGDQDASYQARNPLVDLEILCGNQERAWNLCEINLKRAMESEDWSPAGRRLMQLANASTAFKPLSETRALLEEAAQALRRAGNSHDLCTCLYMLSEVLVLLDEQGAAQQAIQEGFKHCSPKLVPYTFLAFQAEQAWIAIKAGDHPSALKTLHRNVQLKHAPLDKVRLGAAYVELGDERQARIWLNSALQAIQNDLSQMDIYLLIRLHQRRLDIEQNSLANARERLCAAYPGYYQCRDRIKLLVVLESLRDLAVKEEGLAEAARWQQEYDQLRAALGIA